MLLRNLYRLRHRLFDRLCNRPRAHHFLPKTKQLPRVHHLSDPQKYCLLIQVDPRHRHMLFEPQAHVRQSHRQESHRKGLLVFRPDQPKNHFRLGFGLFSCALAMKVWQIFFARKNQSVSQFVSFALRDRLPRQETPCHLNAFLKERFSDPYYSH